MPRSACGCVVGASLWRSIYDEPKGLIDDKFRTGASTEICIKLFLCSYASMLKLADPYDHLTSEEDNAAIVRQLREHTLYAARAYGYDTSQWEGRPVPIAPGGYPIFPGILLAFSRIQEFWVREQRG
jgi:hypothetical protein